ncbi:MAG: lipocalin-like domain-containing protein [Bryobacterales bacterium]|nr:lipocalin-like domain-containing protein [Bryobacterales bacterium]
MKRRTLLSSALPPAACALAAAADPRQPFYGAWRLLRYEFRNKKNGAVVHPYTEKPEGRIAYDAAGRMSAQLMRPGRRLLGGNVPQAGAAAIFEQASAEEIREAAGGYIAYYGSFDVMPAERTVVHRVKGCLIPNWVGTDLRRQYEFRGANRLVLTADTPSATGTLLWEREE